VNLISIRSRFVKIFILILFINNGYSQDFTLLDIINLKKMNRQMLDLYMIDRGYKFHDNTFQNPDFDTKSYKIYDFLDRIHFADFTFSFNNTSVTKINYTFNRSILYKNFISQIYILNFKLQGHYEGDFGTDIYVFRKDKTEISIVEQKDSTMSFCNGCTSYYLEITF
jgi:hypothetical protein